MARPRNADPVATRDRIFEAARAIAVRNGIRSITASAIASEAGVAKSTVGDIAQIFEHLIEHVFAALVAAHSESCAEAIVGRWRAYSASSRLLANEPDLAALTLIACTLAAPSTPSGEAARHARRFRQMHLAAQKAIAADAIAANRGSMSQASALEYAADVVADYLEIATSTLAKELRCAQSRHTAC